MKKTSLFVAALGSGVLAATVIASATAPKEKGFDAAIAHNAQKMIDEGKKTFR